MLLWGLGSATKLSGLWGLLLKKNRAPGSEKTGLLAPGQKMGVSRVPQTPLWNSDGKVPGIMSTLIFAFLHFAFGVHFNWVLP